MNPRSVAVISMFAAIWFTASCAPRSDHATRSSDPASPSDADDGGGFRIEPYVPIVLHPPAPDQYVVEVTSDAEIAAIEAALNVTALATSTFGGGFVVLFQGTSETDAQDFEDAFPDEVKSSGPNDVVDLYAEGGSLVIGFVGWDWSEGDATNQDAYAAMNLEEVHTTTTGAGVRIAVVDTGAEMTHEALAGHVEAVIAERGLVSDETCEGEDEDGDGLIDEGCGHGTFVCGEIAICAPGATIVPIRALNSDGFGSMFDVLRGIELAVEMECDIINLSLCLSGTSEQFDAVLASVRDLGIAVVAASGNAGMRKPLFPGTSPNLLGVAATTLADGIATFSGAGYRIDLGAPGIGVESAYFGGGTGIASGTSMAAPIVSSSIALVMERTGASVLDCVDRLRANARPIVPQTATQFGCLDLPGALETP